MEPDDDPRRRDAALDRRRRAEAADRRLERASVELALLGALGATVAVRAAGLGEPLRAVVAAVGADVVELHSPTATWWLALDRVSAVELAAEPTGDPADRSTTTLSDLVADLVHTDEPVQVVVADGSPLVGTVIAAGASLVLRADGSAATTVVAWHHVVAVRRRGTAPAS